MGIDAEMYIKVKAELKQDDIIYQSYIFGSAFKSYLWLGYDDKMSHKPLEVVDIIQQDEPDVLPEHGYTYIRVPLAGRYYGEGYERGPLLIYTSIAEFLEVLFPSCEVYYGGDISGVMREPFDKAARDKLIQHFIQAGGRDAYSRFFSGNHTKYNCPGCKVAMIQNGFKGKLGMWTCNGCGWMINEVSETEIQQGFNVKMW